MKARLVLCRVTLKTYQCTERELGIIMETGEQVWKEVCLTSDL